MADPNRETLKIFLYQLLLMSLPCNEDVSGVHPFLAENSDKLNEKFALVLQDWAIAFRIYAKGFNGWKPL